MRTTSSGGAAGARDGVRYGERAQRTHTEEFYEVTDLAWSVPALNRQARAWERVYNTVRPDRALGYRTPLQFLHDSAIVPIQQRPTPSLMS